MIELKPTEIALLTKLAIREREEAELAPPDDTEWREYKRLKAAQIENLLARDAESRGKVAVALKQAALSGYRLGHHDTVEGCYQWCDQGGSESVEEIAAEAEAALKEGG